MQPSKTRKFALLTIMAALCLGIQLTPRPPNVEFTSLLVFLVGVLFGAHYGATVGILTMLINGFFSPWGFAGLILPFQATGMAVVGIGGGAYGISRGGKYDSASCIETACLGSFLTLVYDVITNLGIAASFMLIGVPIRIAFINAIISGALFSLVHIVSNTIIFGLTFLPITNSLRKILGGGEDWKEDSLII